MSQTLVGYFEDSDGVTRARQALQQAGFAEGDVTMQAGDNAGSPSVAAATAVAATAIVGSTGTTRTEAAGERTSGIGAVFGSMFGTDHDKARVDFDSEAVERGNYLLVVRCGNDQWLRSAEEILQRCGAGNIGRRAEP